MNTQTDLLNDVTAAELLGIKPRTIRIWRAKRGIPHFRITNKEIRYKKSDIIAWLEGFRKGSAQ